jgi:HSP20 family molecular chaperone IbpA
MDLHPPGHRSLGPSSTFRRKLPRRDSFEIRQGIERLMSRDDLSIWMWSEACRLLDRADTVHRQFFGIAGDTAAFLWEPPADVYETDRRLLIEIALPGVKPGGIEVGFESGLLVVRGERNLPAIPGRAVIRRMEIPHGRFERRIRLPAGRYEFAERSFADGCLQLVLRKIA